LNTRIEDEHLYYYIATTSKEKYLVDAYSGSIVSPISMEMAPGFAKQYVKEKPEIKSCILLNDYMPRKAKDPKKVYKVEFNNPVHSTIYLDYNTGDIIEDIDDNRQFGLWIMRLHEFDFFNSRRLFTSIVGICVFLLALSGLWIYKIRLSKKNPA
jgi:hypothetical protein